jgi:hypothetical protein
MTTMAGIDGRKPISRNVARGGARIRFVCALSLMLCAGTAGVVHGAIVVSLYENPRVFNDFSTSNLTITDNYPSRAVIDDRNLVDDGMGATFANRHDLLFSSDGGASPNVFDINDAFTVAVQLKLDVGANAPRKEAGIRFNSGVTGDALFIVNSDAGEIVAFGGGAPFWRFGENSMLNGYTPGTTILMGMMYQGNATPRTVTYFIDRDPSTPGGIESSVPLEWANVENGPVSFTVGLFAQVSPANGNDFITATFTNISIPEPLSAILLLGAFALLAMPARRYGARRTAEFGVKS